MNGISLAIIITGILAFFGWLFWREVKKQERDQAARDETFPWDWN